MSRRIVSGSVAFLSMCVAVAGAARAQQPETGWPRVLEADHFVITMYQPQIDTWKDDVIESRAAISVQEDKGDPVFGAVWITGRFEVDRESRMVEFFDITVPTVAFPDSTDDDKQRLTAFLEREIPQWDLTVELDRLVPMLDNAEVSTHTTAELGHASPDIIISHRPAVLVLIDGEPRLREVEGTRLQRVANTPYVIVKSGGTYYLASDTEWYVASTVTGPWSQAESLPADVRSLDEALAKQREADGLARSEGGSDPRVPEIVVSTRPAELIFIDGKVEFEPLQGGEILVVSNTDSDVIFEISSQSYFVLLSGRWYRSQDLDNGPWSWVANDALPASFAEIPVDSTVGYLRASVAGTEEAREALLEQAVPQTAAVKTGAGASFSVEYDGPPKFEPVTGTAMQYAVNTAAAVILSGGRYYCCDQGVWYEASSASGPWQVCKEVPDEIYTIPPSNPHYNVTYVKVYEATPEVVYVGYTPGYTSSYISHGCVVYGTGWYYPPYWGPRYYYPHHATWGFHVRWNPWYGWSFGLSYSTGPFTFAFGVGGHGGYWGGGWWGPGWYRPHPWYGYGAAYRAGYRHGYLHGNAAGSRPRPMPYAAGSRPGNNIYARPVNADRVVRTHDRSTRHRPEVARDRANNIYADKNGNVLRRNNDGSWDRRSDGGWSRTDLPATADRQAPDRGSLPGPTDRGRPSAAPRPDTTRPSTGARPASPGGRPAPGSLPSSGSLNRDYSARQRGNTRSQQFSNVHRPSSSRPSGGARRSGARRR